ncbi:hypothetical protein B0H63DRAFT_462421 [Podospora didyma]|uniref:Uncharacterized protein n=1 Tax=Podospora didyma TaxID=330526 RepID=A0AAE0P7T2_9PEZI|nr:hypothetical protein B0H63DRAFT_462421 [Podospora didyma]
MNLTSLLVTLISIILTLHSSPTTAKFVDSAHYSSDLGPQVISRLVSYRTLHNTTLTQPQTAFLKQAVSLLSNPKKAISESLADTLVKGCAAVFAPDQCTYLESGHHVGEKRRGGGGHHAAVAARNELEKRVTCDCASSSSYCIVWGCSGCDWRASCTKKGGCGAYWLYTCNGRCYGC